MEINDNKNSAVKEDRLKSLLNSLPKINTADTQEINRKLVHLLGVVYILAYAIIPRNIVISVMGSILAAILIVEFLRLTNPAVNRFVLGLLKGQWRRNEVRQPSGLTYTFSGALLTMLLFKNTPLILAALWFQVFGDAMAAIVGMNYGRIRIGKKSVEGSLACFIVCLAFGLLFFDYRVAFLGAAAATLIELFPFPKPFDNFLLPIISAVVLKYLIKLLPPM
ncbi:MAG: hypothetical protein WC955_09885 [Elusimicrobiota bacterium]